MNSIYDKRPLEGLARDRQVRQAQLDFEMSLARIKHEHEKRERRDQIIFWSMVGVTVLAALGPALVSVLFTK